jgi:hypothetical protein
MSTCMTQASSSDAAASPKSQILQTILEEESQLSIIDQEISHLDMPLKMLKDERRRVQRNLGIHRSALAPIRRIPSELLSYIFVLCLSGNSYSRRHHINTAPSLFLQVDRQWGTVALSTSRLWSSLFLHAAAPSNPRYSVEALWAKHLLERSGSSPLFLTLNSDGYFFSETTTHPVIDAIVPHAHRIKELEVGMSFVLYSALMPLKGCLSSLQKLTILAARDRPDPERYDVFAVAPALNTLHVIFDPLPMFELPLAQLKFCQLYRGQSVRQIHELPRQMPNLDSLTVSLYQDTGHDTPPSAIPIVSPIRSLKVFTTEQYLEKLWGPFVLPNLRTIDITVQGTFSALWPSVMSLLDRSSCRSKLETFECAINDMDEGALSEFLSTTPSLTKLALRNHNCKEGIGLWDQFLSRLQVTTSTAGALPLIPNLQSLSLSGTFSSDDDTKLADMIESRWRPRISQSLSEPGSLVGTYLQHVELQLYMEVSQQTIGRLEELQRQGLDLKFRFKL